MTTTRKPATALPEDVLVARIQSLHLDRMNLIAALSACADEMFAAVSGLSDKDNANAHNARIGNAHQNARTLLAEMKKTAQEKLQDAFAKRDRALLRELGESE